MYWDDVKVYLESYIGKFYEVADTKDIVYIGKGFSKRICWFYKVPSLIQSNAAVLALREVEREAKTT